MRKIETTYRFGEPLVSLSSVFIQKNNAQLKKDIHPFNKSARTELVFQGYERAQYVDTLQQVIATIPKDKSVFFVGQIFIWWLLPVIQI